MTLPRWLVVSLLTVSVLAVLGFAGWWWVTWPERTARTLVDLMANEAIDKAAVMAGIPPEHLQILHGEMRPVAWTQASLDMEPRTVLDIVHGEQRFKVRTDGVQRRTITLVPIKLVHTFTVRRGSIYDLKTVGSIIDESGNAVPPRVYRQ